MTDKEKIRAFVEGRKKENWEKRYNNSGGDLFWDRANEDDEILSFIDSLQEEPVSEDLEEASRNYADDEEYGDDVYFGIKAAFKAGAQWQEEKDDEERVLTYKHGFEDCKEQMMTKAIDAQCFGFQGAALFSFRLPADNYLVGSEVKVIVIKET